LREHEEIRLVRIDGHTDDVGTTAYNLRLSEDRALAVRRYLIRAGIADDRLNIHGFGQLVPLPAMPNETADEHRTRNRRVEFTIVRRQ
jgi:outer membrane protein OmpA-like peptidoglycan-associated protein